MAALVIGRRLGLGALEREPAAIVRVAVAEHEKRGERNGMRRKRYDEAA
jgi:hypothetical protein